MFYLSGGVSERKLGEGDGIVKEKRKKKVSPEGANWKGT